MRGHRRCGASVRPGRVSVTAACTWQARTHLIPAPLGSRATSIPGGRGSVLTQRCVVISWCAACARSCTVVCAVRACMLHMWRPQNCALNPLRLERTRIYKPRTIDPHPEAVVVLWCQYRRATVAAACVQAAAVTAAARLTAIEAWKAVSPTCVATYFSYSSDANRYCQLRLRWVGCWCHHACELVATWARVPKCFRTTHHCLSIRIHLTLPSAAISLPPLASSCP